MIPRCQKMFGLAFLTSAIMCGWSMNAYVPLHAAEEHKSDHAEAGTDDHAESGHAAEGHGTDAHASGVHGESSHGDSSHGDGEHGDAYGDGHGDGHHGPPSLGADEAFWGFIAFLGFCWAIKKLGLWRSLKTNMAAREQLEIDVIAQAEAKLAEAQRELTACRGRLEAMDETIAEILAEAKRDAEHTQNDILETARREAALISQRAEHEIDRFKDQSIKDLFDHLSGRVTESAIEKVRSSLQQQDQDRLIEETLNQFAGTA